MTLQLNTDMGGFSTQESPLIWKRALLAMQYTECGEALEGALCYLLSLVTE